MRTYLDCIPCFVRQALDTARLVTDDEEIHDRLVRQVLGLIACMDMHQSPPAIAQKIHRLIRQLTGERDPYREKKQQFNELALRMYPALRQHVATSGNPLETAIRLAIAGNVIDFGVNHSVQEADVRNAIDDSLAADFNDAHLGFFEEAVKDAKVILYLGDNAGEVVFDRLLIEQLPWAKTTFVVKAGPIINDATIEDAVKAGLTDMVRVIENGSDAPGTILETCSIPFRSYFEAADLVIAKGQGNYETLSEVGKNVFFILKAKCSVIARNIGCEVGQMIFQKTKAFNGEKENARI